MFTFEEWFEAADTIMLETIGLGLDDLADGPSYDSYDAGVTPRAYVRQQIRAEGFGA
jgi:hypothetical protein